MKILFTTSGDSLKAPLDKRFGRCQNFLVYNTETKKETLIKNNQNLNAVQGAGIQAAQNVLKEKVESVITGHCGPKAFKVLSEGRVKIYNTEIKTIEAALEAFLSGKLQASQAADVEGHWG